MFLSPLLRLKVQQKFALLVFFRGKRGEESIALQDEHSFLILYADLWNQYEEGTITINEMVTRFLGMSDHWEQDLNEIPGLTEYITQTVEMILNHGMNEALKKVC